MEDKKDTRGRQEGYKGETGRMQGADKKETRGRQDGCKGKTGRIFIILFIARIEMKINNLEDDI